MNNRNIPTAFLLLVVPPTLLSADLPALRVTMDDVQVTESCIIEILSYIHPRTAQSYTTKH